MLCGTFGSTIAVRQPNKSPLYALPRLKETNNKPVIKNDKPYLVALRVNGNNWMANLIKKQLPPPSFSTIISQKMPQGNYRAALCWSENGIPKSLLIAKDFAVKNN